MRIVCLRVPPVTTPSPVICSIHSALPEAAKVTFHDGRQGFGNHYHSPGVPVTSSQWI